MSRGVPNRLLTKIFLGASVLISLLVISLLLAVHAGLQASTAQRMQTDLGMAKVTLDHFLNSRFESLRLLSRVVVESPQFKSVVGTPGIDHNTVLAALQEMQQVAGTDRLTVTDQRGRVLARSHAPSEYGEDVSGLEGMREALEGREHLHLQVQDGRLWQTVTLPILLGGVVEGALSAGFAIDSRAADQVVEMIGGQVAWISGSELLAFSGSRQQKARFEYLLAHDLAGLDASALPSAAAAARRLDFGKEKYVTLIFPVRSGGESPPILCVIERSLSQALAFYQQQVQGVLIRIGLAALLVSLLASVLLARGIAGPIGRLKSAAEAVSKGDLSQQVPVHSSDEIGALGRSFNRMIEDLRRTRSDLLASNEYNEGIIRSMIDTLIVVDRNACIQTVNPATLQLLGYREEELIGRPALMILNEPDRSVFSFGKVKDLLRDGSIRRYEMTYRTRSGGSVPVSFHGSILRGKDGKISGILGIARDMRELHQLLEKEKTLIAAEKRGVELERHSQEMTLLSEMGDMLQSCLTAQEAYSSIQNLTQKLLPEWSGALSAAVPDQPNHLEGIAQWGPISLAQGVLVSNDCLSLRRGRMYVLEQIHADALLCQHLHPPLPFCSICVPLVAQGETLGVLHLGRAEKEPLAENTKRLIGAVARTIGLGLANLKLRETLQEQSIRDPLTSLFNRRYLEEALELEARRASRHHHPLGILMLDIDHFKRVNDTYGHDVGDALLRSVGAFLQEHARGGDIACRYGGEEFLVMLPDASVETVQDRAEKIRAGIRQLKVRHGAATLENVTVSVGVAVFPQHGSVAREVLKVADAALYHSKQTGRDRVTVGPPPAAA